LGIDLKASGLGIAVHVDLANVGETNIDIVKGGGVSAGVTVGGVHRATAVHV
jgi:hypothetical protein